MRLRTAVTICVLAFGAQGAAIAALLSSAAAIKKLSPEEAGEARKVVLTGVVTQVIPEWWAFTVQDSTDGIYVSAGGPIPSGLTVGRAVRVEGTTARGNFAPSVRAKGISILGAAAMPKAARVNWAEFATGGCDNNYVEVEGVARSSGPVEPPAWEWPALAVRIDVGGNLLWAYVRDAQWRPPAPLVDSTVRVRGVCVVFSNSQRQFQGVVLSVNRDADIDILEPASSDPFHAPLQRIGQLFGFQRGSPSFHRVRVEGIATLQRRGAVYIQDASGGMLVRASSAPPVRPGDRVEAVGFPAAGGYATVLDDALLRVVGHGTAPAPRPMPANAVVSRAENAPSAPNAVLLQVSGLVVDRTRFAQGDMLVLSDRGTNFTARLPGAGALAGVEPGSRVAVTGVCAVNVDDRGLPVSFDLLMRSAEDARILKRPPRVSRSGAVRVAAGLLGILGAAAIWLVLLRRRVGQQTATIRAQFEREAVLQKRYTDLVENASDLVYVRDLDGRLLQVNRGAEEMTGFSREELLASNILDLLAPEERERGRRDLALRPGADQSHTSAEWRFQTKDGRELIVETKERFLPEDGEPVRVECIGRDVTARHRAQAKAVTERDRLEEQLQHSQKLESVGQLAGGVAHDFNNLLTVISGYAQMLADDPTESLRRREAAREILGAAERAGDLTRQLLLFSRRQKPAPRILRLNDVLRGMEKMLRRLLGENVSLKVETEANDGRILADPGHVEQVVMNLVVNARDAMPGGGEIVIRTSNTMVSAEEAAYLDLAPGRHVRLEVTDSGVGIPPELQTRIFEPFFTTKEKGKGTGLGLSTVYGIVKQAGGAITVDSVPGRTTFGVLFPAAEGIPAEADEAPRRVEGGAETILVAEDEEGVRNFISMALRSRGYTVLEASNGRDAVEVAMRHPGPIHLLLTDVAMPELGGVALADEFRRIRPGRPVLHISGYTDEAMRLSAIDDFLEKPFTPAALLQRIRERLQASEGGATA